MGGSPDQNLILLDGVPVYNVNHLFGLFSVFNPDAVNSVTLYKGGFPARFGGRLSSVIDIRMKEGNMNKLKGNFSLGIISSKISLEGPIIKDRCSFIVSARRTYLDILTWPLIKIGQAMSGADKLHTGYFFQDINGKINFKLDSKNHLYFSIYTGRDKFYLKSKTSYSDIDYSTKSEDKFDLHWGNATSALRWNSLISKKLFLNTTATYSRYLFLTSMSSKYEDLINSSKDEYKFKYHSGIDDWALKSDLEYYVSNNFTTRFGLHHIYHRYQPGVTSFSSKYVADSTQESNNSIGNNSLYSHESSAYSEFEFSPFSIVKFNLGLHGSMFFVNKKQYTSLQPRASFRVMLGKKISVKGSFAQMDQYIHLLTNSGILLPIDLWVPATDSVRPQRSYQYVIGSVFAINSSWEIMCEMFYKKMNNVIDYKDGASFISALGGWESKIEQGKGEAYGFEFMLSKTSGKLNGWIAYTLSWNYRQYPNISLGKKFYFRYDRRHDLAIVLNYKLLEKLNISAVWSLASGSWMSMPTQRYDKMAVFSDLFYYYESEIIDYYEVRNNYQVPLYHRLDLNMQFTKQLKRGKRTWSLGAYNCYNRKNPFFVSLREDYFSLGNKTKLVMYSLPLIPFVSYSFEF